MANKDPLPALNSAPLGLAILLKAKKAAEAAFKWVETEEKMRVKTYETFTHFTCNEKPNKLWQ